MIETGVEKPEHCQGKAQISECGSHIRPVISALACTQFDEQVVVCAEIRLLAVAASKT